MRKGNPTVSCANYQQQSLSEKQMNKIKDNPINPHGVRLCNVVFYLDKGSRLTHN